MVCFFLRRVTYAWCCQIVDTPEAMAVGDLAVPVKNGILKPGNEIQLGVLSLGETDLFSKHSKSWVGSKKRLTFFKSCGTAAQDIVTAQVALKAAEKANLGVLH